MARKPRRPSRAIFAGNERRVSSAAEEAAWERRRGEGEGVVVVRDDARYFRGERVPAWIIVARPPSPNVTPGR